MKARITNGITRAALYTRVSTDEQARHGLSLDAQLETLKQYAKENGLHIAGIYSDEGISARKSYKKRPAVIRLLGDCGAGKIDVILFIKLDRWFRNIADFYEVQSQLDKCGVQWIATEEEYDTTTANGRLHLNIKLSIAQDEADRTSERIRFVFDAKKKRGEAITGSLPVGYKIVDKHLVIDEQAAVRVREACKRYLNTHSIGATARWYSQEYGVPMTAGTIKRMLTNTLYIGEAYGVKDYCPAIIDRETFQRMQEMLFERSPRNSTVPKRVYLFNGICFCAECGKSMHGNNSRNRNYYRCRRHEEYRDCNAKSRTSEDAIERYLLDNLALSADNYNVELRKKKSEIKRIDVAKLRKKMDKLKDLYLNDLIDISVYEKEYMSLKQQIEIAEEVNEREEAEINVTELKDLLKLYHTLSREGQRAFWLRTVRRIEVDAERNITIYPA